jgi:hypothetical protein
MLPDPMRSRLARAVLLAVLLVLGAGEAGAHGRGRPARPPAGPPRTPATPPMTPMTPPPPSTPAPGIGIRRQAQESRDHDEKGEEGPGATRRRPPLPGYVVRAHGEASYTPVPEYGDEYRPLGMTLLDPMGRNEIKTGNGTVRVTWPDGSVFQIGKNSHVTILPEGLYIHDSPDMSALQRAAGNPYGTVYVEKRRGQFIIRTPTVLNTIKGSEVWVQVAADGTTTMRVVEGSLESNPHATGQVFLLGPGQMIRIAPDGSAERGTFSAGDVARGRRELNAPLRDAIRRDRAAAERGDADAQARLADLYLTGRGVRRDPAEAARWFRRAAERGHGPAQYFLGVLLGTGVGTSADPVEAYQWLTLAASSGVHGARETRKWLADAMTPAEIARGEKQAREWSPGG